ncbi:MAG: DNA polymerase I, partial [Thermoanaerobacteraceae bacterium]|nr:DNA polymerase I [Thermoanaerobacteraceae bacterium]
PIQGSAADIIKIAMVKVYKHLKENNLKAKILLQVHDELILDVPENELSIVKQILKHDMENAIPLKVPLVVDFTQGYTWEEL